MGRRRCVASAHKKNIGSAPRNTPFNGVYGRPQWRHNLLRFALVFAGVTKCAPAFKFGGQPLFLIAQVSRDFCHLENTLMASHHLWENVQHVGNTTFINGVGGRPCLDTAPRQMPDVPLCCVCVLQDTIACLRAQTHCVLQHTQIVISEPSANTLVEQVSEISWSKSPKSFALSVIDAESPIFVSAMRL